MAHTLKLPRIPSHHVIGSNPIFWAFLLVFFAGALTLSFVLSLNPALPLLATLIVAATILLLNEPFLLLGALIVIRMSLDYTTAFYALPVNDTALSLSQVFGIGVALLGIVVIARHRGKLMDFPLLFPFALILSWGSLTLVYSVSPTASLQELVRVFDLFALSFFAFLAVKDTRDIKRLFSVFFVASVLPVLFGMAQFFLGIGLVDPNVDTPRIFGTFSHPNVFSLFLFVMVILSFSFFLFLALSRTERIISLSLFLLACLVLLLTFSRVAWIALFLFFLALGIFRYRLALFPLIMLPLLLFGLSTSFQSRVLDSFATDPDSSLVWRQNLWRDTTTQAVADQRVLLGTGLDTFPLVSENLRGIKLGSNEAHNDFVKFFIDGGLVGLAVFLVFLVSISLILARHALHTPDPILRNLFWFLFLLFVILQVSALTDNVFKNTPVQWLFFSLLGAVLGREAVLLKKMTGS